MKPEIQPTDLRYILQEDLYLLPADKTYYNTPQTLKEVVSEPVPESGETLVAEPAPIPETPVDQSAPIPETPVAAIKYLGNNQKNFLILAYDPDAEFMAAAHLTALQNTLSRIGYSPDDIAIVNMTGYPEATWRQMLAELSPKKMVLLGDKVLPKDLAPLNLNEIGQRDGITILQTFSFSEMMGNKEKITAFWNQIKTF